MGNFTGQLKPNEIFASLFNFIISQEVFTDNIQGDDLVDKARVDGSLYGDTKLYYANDVLKSHPWLNDGEASNLLNLSRPADPATQAITLDIFRQIDLTVDFYLSKRAWGSEYVFSQFTASMLAWMPDTKKVHDATTYNAFFGTCEGDAKRSLIEVPISTATTGLTGEEVARVEAQTFAKAIADLTDDMTDYSRDFNDYRFLRRYSRSSIKVVWNSIWLNKLTLVDTPTIFHKDILSHLTDESLNSKYFGHIADAAVCAADVYDASTNPTGNLDEVTANKKYTLRSTGVGIYRSMIETDYTVSGTTTHVFAGDEIPSGATFNVNEVYQVCEDIICKIIIKYPPFMSAFETGTNFFNAKSLTENHYLTWGYNTLEYLKNYPMITVEAD